MKRRLAFLIPAFLVITCAQTTRYNQDESKVPPYTLPDSLRTASGQVVSDANTWNTVRRPELIGIFEDQVYGKTPADPVKLRTGEVVTDAHALGGKAVRKQVTIYFSPLNRGPRMNLLLYVPASAKGPVPVFLGLNFTGNHTVSSDPGILIEDVWMRDPADRTKLILRVPDDRSRGSAAAQWQLEKILAHGYGLATIYYCDIEPDFDGGWKSGARSLFPDPESWSAMGAWAWGLSRALDVLAKDPSVMPRGLRSWGIPVWAKPRFGRAQDRRFAMVISNESGKGGVWLLKRGFGETIDHLNIAFPHWFCPNYKQYNGHPEKLPVDGNELLALIAPRPLYVASAEGDLGSDPKGEFLSAVDAGRVYALFGKHGLGTVHMPPPDQPIMHDIAYHVRTGKHDVTDYDWDQYLAFADLHWGKRN